GPADGRCAGQGDLVPVVLTAADHHNVLRHAGALLTLFPMPLTMGGGRVPGQRAHSWMVGVRPSRGPNTVAVVPRANFVSPGSLTIWSMDTRQRTGQRCPPTST